MERSAASKYLIEAMLSERAVPGRYESLQSFEAMHSASASDRAVTRLSFLNTSLYLHASSVTRLVGQPFRTRSDCMAALKAVAPMCAAAGVAGGAAEPVRPGGIRASGSLLPAHLPSHSRQVRSATLPYLYYIYILPTASCSSDICSITHAPEDAQC